MPGQLHKRLSGFSKHALREVPYWEIDFLCLQPHLVGCFGVPRCHETAGNKKKQGEKDKEIQKEETQNARNPYDFVAVVVGIS